MARIRRAIISVSDKRGIVEFAKGLKKIGIDIYASGGTAKLLKENRIPVKSIDEYTGFPEILDGRVKTLHPRIHAGILAVRDNREHMKVLNELDITTFDMVVVNLYPFEATVAKPECSLEEAIENIDIGGPTLLRAAAKNYRHVCVVVDPDDYGRVLEALRRKNGNIDEELLFSLAKKVFRHTAWYDSAISNYLSSLDGDGRKEFPEVFSWQWDKVQELRYGENPHQKAAFYRDTHSPVMGVGYAEQLQGKELSYNNIVDIDAAFSLALEFDDPTVAIIKHTNPCGVGSARSIADAYKRAFACDPVSAYGGIIGVNRKVSASMAKAMEGVFFEAIIAPDYDREALKILSKKKNLRVMRVDAKKLKGRQPKYVMKNVAGGLLVQTVDDVDYLVDNLKVVTKREPTEKELQALIFAWRVCKHVKSNAIVITGRDRTVGIGAGQMSRVDSAKIAIMKAQSPTKGCVAASDAFFPFRDGLDVLAEAGITAVIQPGGSIRDEEVIKAADEHGIAMVFTGIRHFRH
ncbi:MAG: bifunctional phosphoribosylaminoimidazolecarboxamide formyltransferase/IMP cyclohydrolase PurH [Deltaproteobacteria bacterium]|nr:MAG: bifunctional phosphoribosylaminoimidazolecarboxamide formyltransferase/IMP cyclohydrolase PurH [Deltaproteobacteria bacterium]